MTQGITLLIGALLSALVFLAWRAQETRDIPEQKTRAPRAEDMDADDLMQQAELDRLHRVDKHFDGRLDDLEFHRAVLFALLVVSLLADLAQLYDSLFGGGK